MAFGLLNVYKSWDQVANAVKYHVISPWWKVLHFKILGKWMFVQLPQSSSRPWGILEKWWTLGGLESSYNFVQPNSLIIYLKSKWPQIAPFAHAKWLSRNLPRVSWEEIIDKIDLLLISKLINQWIPFTSELEWWSHSLVLLTSSNVSQCLVCKIRTDEETELITSLIIVICNRLDQSNNYVIDMNSRLITFYILLYWFLHTACDAFDNPNEQVLTSVLKPWCCYLLLAVICFFASSVIFYISCFWGLYYTKSFFSNFKERGGGEGNRKPLHANTRIRQ